MAHNLHNRSQSKMKYQRFHQFLASFLAALTITLIDFILINIALLLIGCTSVSYSNDDRKYARYAAYQPGFDPATISSREVMTEADHYCRHSTNSSCLMDRVYYICNSNLSIKASICTKARRVTKNSL